jgi:hypothetical protein
LKTTNQKKKRTPPTIKITFHEGSKLKRPVRVFPAIAARIAPYSNNPWAYIIPAASCPVLGEVPHFQ